MNKRQVAKRYNEMINFPQNKGELKEGRVNCYRCDDCGTITKTIEIDKGVTPFFHFCSNENCDSFAASAFYEDILPDSEPIEEWYRPTLEETLELLKRGYMGSVDHILQGGLDVRKINNG